MLALVAGVPLVVVAFVPSVRAIRGLARTHLDAAAGTRLSAEAETVMTEAVSL